jgi:hypothetical protein
MKKLTVLGEDKDWNKELEIFHKDCDAPHGFNCKIAYIDSCRIKEETRHNCTEFHHRYDFDADFIKDPDYETGGTDHNHPAYFYTGSSAFESDIHRTGGTVKLSQVKSIEITIADKLNDSY